MSMTRAAGMAPCRSKSFCKTSDVSTETQPTDSEQQFSQQLNDSQSNDNDQQLNTDLDKDMASLEKEILESTTASVLEEGDKATSFVHANEPVGEVINEPVLDVTDDAADAFREYFENEAREIFALATEHLHTHNHHLFLSFYRDYRAQSKNIYWVQKFWFDNPLPE